MRKHAIVACATVLAALGAATWQARSARAAETTNEHFLTREITTTARFVRSVAAGDVDGDGDLDILSALPVDGEVVWFENGGTPNDKFTARHVIDADADGAGWIQAADFDGDGDVDPVVGVDRFTSSMILWYENLGGQPVAFRRNVLTTNLRGVSSLHAADLDGDGDVDLLSATLIDDMIAWYENDGNSPPSFTQHIITMDPDGPGPIEGFADGALFVSAGDVDGDGDTDILFTAGFASLLGWFENDGARPPSFAPQFVAMGFTPINGPASVLTVDLDGDGDMDLASSSVTDDRIGWFENDGAMPPSFTFHNITQSADAPWVIAAADMDADGDMDLLSASEQDSKIAWYESDGARPPSFTIHVLSTDAIGTREVIAADLNGDGRPDVVSASKGNHTIAWYVNRIVLPPGLRR